MALTSCQIEILQLCSKRRKAAGESYVAGGLALNTVLHGARLSRDIDIFHDTTQALRSSWDSDRQLLENSGYSVDIVRESAAYVESLVGKGGQNTLVQWLRDSSFRFFPLVEHELLGLTMHPFDLATNKILALAGRLEPRDWVDTIECHRKVQKLGFLIWAACGKDPGVNPDMILTDAARTHYSQTEFETLDFDSLRPNCVDYSNEWKSAVTQAKCLVDLLPPEHIGSCIVHQDGTLYQGDASTLAHDLAAGVVGFHQGCIGGTIPEIIDKT